MYSNTVHDALKALASVDTDRAKVRNNIGFNGLDSKFGHELAKLPHLTVRQTQAAYRMLRKYRDQLALFGIDYDKISDPGELAPPTPSVRRASHRSYQADDGVFLVRFDYDAQLVEEIKKLPGDIRRWDSDRRAWVVKAKDADAALFRDFLLLHGFKGDDTALDAEIKIYQANQVLRDEIAELSKADYSEIEIPGLVGEPYPFQKVAVEYVQTVGNTLIGDQMGIGKTLEAIMIAMAEDLFPVLICCPANLRLTWAKEIKRWTPQKTICLVGQHEPSDFNIVSYDVIARDMINRIDQEGNQVYYRKSKVYDPAPRLQSLLDSKFKMLVLDESHLLKENKTKRTRAVVLLSKGPERVVAMTGTAVVSRPRELLPQLKILGKIDRFGGEFKFLKRYCAGRKIEIDGESFWDFNGSSNEKELYRLLRENCYIRRLKKDVLSELPPKIYSSIPLEIDNRKEYDEAAANFLEFLKEHALEVKNIDIDALDTEELVKRTKQIVESASRAEAIVRINTLRQLAAKGKLQQSISWISNFLESDEKLVVFAWHQLIQKELIRAFKDPAFIVGGMNKKKLQANVDRFQDDDDCRLIICSIKAGGVGHTLTAASNVAFVEFPWTPGDLEQAIDRTHRIGQFAETVNSWYHIGEQTIDEHMINLIEDKRVIVNAIQDGEEMETESRKSIFGDLIDVMLTNSEREV